MKLTAKRVLRFLKRPGRYPDGDNLYLQVATPGKGSWLLRYEHNGRERLMGLGPLHTIGLAEARDRAKRARQQLLDGIDPLDHKRAQRQQQALQAARAMTFEQAARTWHSQHERGWKNPKHGRQVLETLATYAFPKIGNLPVGEIDTGLVLKCIEPDWATKTETMSRVRGRIESVLDWCTVRGYRSGDNPARWKGHIAEVLPARGKIAKPVHHAALPYTQIAEFVAELRTREGVAARALEFLILTAARTGEVIGARAERSISRREPGRSRGGRMKGGRSTACRLPRSRARIAARPADRGWQPARLHRPACGHRSLQHGDGHRAQAHARNDVTVHGFRSCFMDWCHEKTAFPKVVIDMALAHVVGDKVEAAYRRGDLLVKRKALSDAWAAFCSKPAANGDVVPSAGAKVRALDPTLPPWKSSTERDRKALVRFTLAELLRFDALVAEEDFEKHDHYVYAINKSPSPPARDPLTAAKAAARRGNLKPLRHCFRRSPSSSPSRNASAGSDARRIPSPASPTQDGSPTWCGGCARSGPSITADGTPSTDTLMIEIVAKYLELDEVQVRRALKKASR